jgi:prolyl oligopeptidase
MIIVVKCCEIELPGLGSAGGFSGKKKEETLYSFTNYTTPGTTYSFKAKEGNQQYIKTKSRF